MLGWSEDAYYAEKVVSSLSRRLQCRKREVTTRDWLLATDDITHLPKAQGEELFCKILTRVARHVGITTPCAVLKPSHSIIGNSAQKLDWNFFP